jgi:hypothetical protein
MAYNTITLATGLISQNTTDIHFLLRQKIEQMQPLIYYLHQND